jgi:hypothetical protein
MIFFKSFFGRAKHKKVIAVMIKVSVWCGCFKEVIGFLPKKISVKNKNAPSEYKKI